MVAWVMVVALTAGLTQEQARSLAAAEIERALPAGARVGSLRLGSLDARGRRASELRLAAPPARGQARLCLESITKDGRRVPEQWLSSRVELCGQVWVARAALAAGSDVQRQLIAREERCGVELDALAFAQESVEGSAPRRRLVEGQVLTGSDLAPAPLVRAGQLVTLQARRGALAVRALGVALDSAPAGQPVQVRLRGQRAAVQGIAVGPQLVEVLP